MPAYRSAPDDLALHGVRVLGFATAAAVAGRYGLDAAATAEYLLDFQAHGWVRRHTYPGTPGWSVTASGRAENERRLAAELDTAGVRDAVTAARTRFAPLNRRLAAACANWQVRPTRADPMAANDHTDGRWDARALSALASLDTPFRQLCDHLAAALERFGCYADRYSAALRMAEAGQRAWVDAPDRESCHLVWSQFREDLLATLGTPPGPAA